jgi:hypothetical protein
MWDKRRYTIQTLLIKHLYISQLQTIAGGEGGIRTYAACFKPSSFFNQRVKWFQLVKIWATILRS